MIDIIMYFLSMYKIKEINDKTTKYNLFSNIFFYFWNVSGTKKKFT